MKDLGVIKGAIAGISVPYLDAVPIVVFGRSKTASFETTLDRLAESDLSRRALVAGGNFLYVVGLLRNISELDSYADFVRRTTEMQEPTVGIYNPDDGLIPDYTVDGGGWKRRSSYKELSPLDLKIIASLKDDARKPIAEIAEMVGVTSKTARRHLESMISEGSLEFTVPADMLPGGDMLTLVHVNLREGADKEKFGKRLLSKRWFRDQYVRTFSNLPGFLVWVFWSDKIMEIRRAFKEVAEDEDVVAIMPNFAYLERLYQTWRDRLPEVRNPPSVKTRDQKQRSGRWNR